MRRLKFSSLGIGAIATLSIQVHAVAQSLQVPRLLLEAARQELATDSEQRAFKQILRMRNLGEYTRKACDAGTPLGLIRDLNKSDGLGIDEDDPSTIAAWKAIWIATGEDKSGFCDR